MMKKLLVILVIFAYSNKGLAQNLNGYKYASVPAQFGFLDEKDKYRLNTLTKLFMQKYGFETYMESEIVPSDFMNSNCSKIYVDVEKTSSMFVTKLKVVLKDCYGKVLFTSIEGTSREKEYRVAYNEALREAFRSFSTLNYKYVEKKGDEKPIEVLKVNEVVEQPEKGLVENKATTFGQLFAQPIQNGFQLINTEPKMIMKLYKTTVKDFYIAVKGDILGVFITINSEWFFEYYKNDQLVSEKVDVKF